MASKVKRKQSGFRSISASMMAPTLLMSHLKKNLAFRLKRHCLSEWFFWEKNIRFASLTSHLSNGKLGKRIGETISSPHTKEGMEVNTTLRG